MLGWMNHKLESRLPGEVSTTSDDTMLMTEIEEEIKSLLMKVKEESEKPGLTFKPQKSKVIASGPITSWQIEEEKLEAVPSLLSFGSKITADSDYSHEIKKCLFLEKKPMTNIDSVLKSREITLPKNVCLVKVMVFPVVMYGCESLAIKKAEH